MTLLVSRRLKRDFDNGEDYTKHRGEEVRVPRDTNRRPRESLLHPSRGEVVNRRFQCANRLSLAEEPIDLSESRLVDPYLFADRAHLSRHVLEQIEAGSPPLLVGDGRGTEPAAADRAAVLRVSGFRPHGSVSLFSLGGFAFLVQGSSHFRGSSQWTVMTWR